MDNEKLLSQINDGRTAAVLYQWMLPLFTEVESDLINSMKSQFRAGTYTEMILACHVAQLCSIEDLKVKIKGIAVRGDAAAMDLSDRGDDDGNQ